MSAKKAKPTRLTIIQVAVKIGVDYQVARKLMLLGKMGLSKYDHHTRELTVTEEGTNAYLAAQKAPKTAV